MRRAAALSRGLLFALAVLLSPSWTSAYPPTVLAPIPAELYQPVTRTGEPPLRATPRPTGQVAATPEPPPTPTATAQPEPPRPTAKPSSGPVSSSRLLGRATWYCLPGTSKCMAIHPTGGMYAAAGPALRAALGKHWRHTRVTVCSSGQCVRVELADWCACGGGHTIDLYSDAFRQLAPLSRGVIDVTIRW